MWWGLPTSQRRARLKFTEYENLHLQLGIYRNLVGTQVIELVKPKVVMVELCKGRADRIRSKGVDEAQGVRDLVTTAQRFKQFESIGSE